MLITSGSQRVNLKYPQPTQQQFLWELHPHTPLLQIPLRHYLAELFFPMTDTFRALLNKLFPMSDQDRIPP